MALNVKCNKEIQFMITELASDAGITPAKISYSFTRWIPLST